MYYLRQVKNNDMGIENKTARDLVYVKFIAISYHRTRSKKISPKGTSNTRDLRILSLAVGLIGELVQVKSLTLLEMRDLIKLNVNLL